MSESISGLALCLAMSMRGLVAVIVFMTMTLALTLHAVAALELALHSPPGVVDHTLGAAPHGAILWRLLSKALNLNASDNDLANWSLDELDCDRRNAIDEPVANFDNSDFDIDNLEVLVLIDTLGTNSQTIS
ncbi:hypothetical protein HG530_002417 [Fusarium avenaceum]|nr:hypothetical protein HG530_002417 [Fusarium avenaceum]